ncbi:MAG: polysaccharide deacetylase family protein [Tannerellaceae bacterium]|nr:polysaccharide deacetylase family protein [Tannerellaceae bacterium]
MDTVISYIIEFLIKGEKSKVYRNHIGYTANPTEFHKYKIVIIPSFFFREDIYGTETSLPNLPLKEIHGIPLLFGTPNIEWMHDTLLVYADIIASSYFLLTRYEEIRKRNQRDIHGRFPGKASLPFNAQFIHRPIVDEYGHLLRDWLRETGIPIEEPHRKINRVWLTHDVDIPFYCRSLRNVIRESIYGRGFKQAWNIYNASLTEDPFFTFPWLIDQNLSLEKIWGKSRCKSIFFFKTGGKSHPDKPFYHIQSKDIQCLLSLCQQKGMTIGLHSSYDAGRNPALIRKEKEKLENNCKTLLSYNRHHYLSSREPEDLEWLEKAGITDDFTMGYADVAGFRLGTCHPVRWINPINKRLSNLILHPLTIMECSLSDPDYMSMDYRNALTYCLGLVDQVEKNNGELTLLWHNNRVSTHMSVSIPWQRTLYQRLIEELKKR